MGSLSRFSRAIVEAACFSALLSFAQSPDKPKENLASAPSFHFTDITASTGIRFEHAISPEKKYLYESIAGGVLLIDYDQDGWLDIYFTNAPSVAMALRGQKVRGALYHNNHHGTFTDVSDKAGVAFPCWAMGGAVGDYNNDGWPDMLITCQDGVVLYRNNGDGTFSNASKDAHLTDPRWSTGAAFGDYDGDGFVDLMVTRYVDLDLKNLPPFGVGATCHYRGIPVQCGPRGMKGLGDSLYHNNGDGTFTDVSKAAGVDDDNGYYGLGVLWSDLNGDGRPDIYIANDSTPSYLYRNDGGGKFTDVSFASGTAVSAEGAEMAGMGVAMCNYDHSGRFSIHVTNFENQYNSLFRNDGDLSFTDSSIAAGIAAASTPLLKWGTGCVDLDNDGWADLFVVNGHVYPQVDGLPVGARYREPMLAFLNSGNGKFRDASDTLGSALKQPWPSRGAAFGDLDNDGDIDVVVENVDGPPVILRNDGGNQKHWITFELVGTKSNREALGAFVKAVAGSLVQVDEVRSGGSYLSQNDMRVHFGLGDADKLDRVEIRWPSGRTETLQNLAANRFYMIKEGEGMVSPEQTRPAMAKSKTH